MPNLFDVLVIIVEIKDFKLLQGTESERLRIYFSTAKLFSESLMICSRSNSLISVSLSLCSNGFISSSILLISSFKIIRSLFKSSATLSVIVLSNLVISLIRNMVPSRIRIIVQLGIVATLVAIVDMILKAYDYGTWKQLSVFIGLIITNCIVMGRLEAFAMGNKPWDSVLDGLGSGFGYSWVILVIAIAREVFGAGKLLGMTVVPPVAYDLGYVNNGLMAIPVGAFMIVAIIIWVQRSNSGYVEE